jgi:hypothetical protein
MSTVGMQHNTLVPLLSLEPGENTHTWWLSKINEMESKWASPVDLKVHPVAPWGGRGVAQPRHEVMHIGVLQDNRDHKPEANELVYICSKNTHNFVARISLMSHNEFLMSE